MSGGHFEDKKICGRCHRKVPAGLLACPNCALMATGIPNDIRMIVVANIENDVHVSKTAKIVNEKLAPHFPRKRVDPKRPDTGDNFEFPDEPLRIR